MVRNLCKCTEPKSTVCPEGLTLTAADGRTAGSGMRK